MSTPGKHLEEKASGNDGGDIQRGSRPSASRKRKSHVKATATSKKKAQQSQQGAARGSDDEDELVNRRTKKPKMGRVGRTAGKNYPPEIQRALGRAHMLYVEGNVIEASQELSQVVVQCSSIPEPYALLALIYQDGGKYQEALVFYKLACARDPRKLGNHREAARIAGILGDHTSRLEALKVLARLQPNNLNVAIDRARCLLELQKPKQALDVYAKAAKRFPRRYDIYLDLAEGVECVSPQQHLFVHQALASCLRRAIGKKHLAPDVRDLADGFAARLHEMKLERPKPKALPPRSPGLPSKRVSEVAMTATDLLVTKLMESRKRQEPQYEVAVQAVEGLVSWLDSCRAMASRAARSGRESAEDRNRSTNDDGDDDDDDEEDDADEDEGDELDNDSDVRDSNNEESDGDEEGDEAEEGAGGHGNHANRRGGGAEKDEEDDDGGGGDDDDDDDDEPMDCFTLDPTILLRYGICQLYCGEKQKASKAFAFLDHEEPEGPHGDMMLEIAKVYAETDNIAESLIFLRQVAQSTHPRHRLADIQLGASYASQGKYELALEAYGAVLAERPHHMAGLAGLAECAYWRGKAAAPTVLMGFASAVQRATNTWTAAGILTDSHEDDEGEHASGFQRVQLLMQWATLSRMAGRTADFACVALPLVSVALSQVVQRREFEKKQASAVADTRIARVARNSDPTGVNALEMGSGVEKAGQSGIEARGDQQVAGGSDKGTGGVTDPVEVWKPGPVPPLLDPLPWQVDFRGKVSTLMLLLLETTDVSAQVGRRAIFWHLIEVVRALLELGNPDQVKDLVDAAIQPNGLLRGLEREDLQIVAKAKDDVEILSTMPGGSPLQGPACREAVLFGPGNNPPHSSSELASHAVNINSASEQFHAPPWRCVEDEEDDDIPRRAGRAWRPNTRTPLAGPRRSRSRALMELAEAKDDGDAICALVRALSRTPGNAATWNLLQRVATARGVEAADGGFHGEQVEALVSRHRERPQGLLYRGHDAVLWNRSKQALRLYSQAHVALPDEPLPILCLAMHTIRVVTVMENLVENDSMCALQALACLHHYANLRSTRSTAYGGTELHAAGGTGGPATGSTARATAVPDAALEQEVLYNMGRGYHHLGLAELAMEYYNRVLRIEDEMGDELRKWHGGETLTRETALNLCALYKRNGATAMALRVLNKYLSVG